MPYEYLDDYTIADIAFQAEGRTLEEVFVSAADAVMNVMIENLEEIQPHTSRDIDIDDSQLDLLLFQFLQELLYYKDAERLLLRASEIEIEESQNGNRLRARLQGEALDVNRHQQRIDVKAITLHEFSLKQANGQWRAQVLLDV